LLVGEARGVAATLTLALLEDGTGALYPVPDLNRTTEDSYTTVTVCVLLYPVRPERSVSEVEGRAWCRALFDSAAHAATLRANGGCNHSRSAGLCRCHVVRFSVRASGPGISQVGEQCLRLCRAVAAATRCSLATPAARWTTYHCTDRSLHGSRVHTGYSKATGRSVRPVLRAHLRVCQRQGNKRSPRSPEAGHDAFSNTTLSES
jgi:hypothetical protein